MMKDTRLLIRLKEYVNYASTAESNLAHYITEDPQAVIGKSIHELARLTYTSPSTIVLPQNGLSGLPGAPAGTDV